MEIIEWKFIYILSDLTRNSCEICNYRSLAGIEPVALRSNVQVVLSYFDCFVLLLRNFSKPRRSESGMLHVLASDI